MKLLCFETNANKFAIALNSIAIVTLLPKIETIPSSLKALEGVLNFRGEFIPVFSLAALMGQPAPAMHPYQNLVIVKSLTRYFALRVERMLDQFELEESKIVESKSISSHLEKIVGLVAGPSGVIFIQNPDAFLSSAEQEILDREIEEMAPLTDPQDSS